MNKSDVVKAKANELGIPFVDVPVERDHVDLIISYECGELEMDDTLKLFARMIKSGEVWSLQGHYGRMAKALIEGAWISPEGEVLRWED